MSPAELAILRKIRDNYGAASVLPSPERDQLKRARLIEGRWSQSISKRYREWRITDLGRAALAKADAS